MSWKEVKGYKPGTQELYYVCTYVLSELSKTSSAVSTYKSSYRNAAYPVVFRAFMKRLHKVYKISPNDVGCFLTKHPEYIQDIYMQRLKPLQAVLIQATSMETNKEVSFATLYYDRYAQYGSADKALEETLKYPFAKFDDEFVAGLFAKYPFLKDEKHLQNALDKLKEKKYAYYVTENGIHSEY